MSKKKVAMRKPPNLKPGDKVKMNNRYVVPEKNRNKVWTVASEPWECCGEWLVRLEEYPRGGYAADGLTLMLPFGSNEKR